MSRHRILVAPAHYRVSDREGSESYVSYKIVEELAKRGHELTVLAALWQVRDFDYPNVTVVPMVPDGRAGGTLRESWRRFRFPRFVEREGRRRLAAREFDLVYHVRPSSTNTANYLFWRDRTHPHLMGPMVATQRYASPHDMSSWLGTRPGPGEWLATAAYKLLHGRLHRDFVKTMGHVDALVCPTAEAKREYAAYLPAWKIAVIPFGVERYGRLRRKAAKRLRVLAVAKVVERKGLDVLLEAAAGLRDRGVPFVVRIVGDGPALPALRAQAERFGLAGAVRFEPPVEHSKIAAVYADADVFCSPTRSEPFGQTILEAMSAGLPVVASEVGALPELVTPRTGVLVPPDDPSALVTALERLDADPARRRRLGEAGRRRAETTFSWKAVIDEYEKVMDRTIAAYRRRNP